MAGIERRRPNRRSTTGSRASKGSGNKTSGGTARDRRTSREAPADALTLLKAVGSRIFGVQPARSRDRSQEKRKSRRTRSDSSTRTRSSRPGGGMPPVLVRRGLSDMATPSRRFKAPRRRYDVSLNVPGAEMRLPSLPAVHFGWRVLSGLLLFMMATVTYMLLNEPAFQVDLVQVEGLERLSLADLDQGLGIAGEPVVSLDAREIEADLISAFQGIREVRVVIGLPASVQLKVKERQPVAAWVYQGETRWLDEQGIVFEPDEGGGPLPLTVHAEILPVLPDPALDGITDPAAPQLERFDPELVSVIQTMNEYRPADAQMIYDDNHGLGWSDARGWQVYFGRSLKEMDQKLVVYQAVAQQLEANGVQPSMISVEYLHAPFFRTER